MGYLQVINKMAYGKEDLRPGDKELVEKIAIEMDVPIKDDFIETAICKNCENCFMKNNKLWCADRQDFAEEKGHCSIWSKRNTSLREYESIEEPEKNLMIGTIKKFSDKLDLARQFIAIIPLYYDEAGLWWMWDYSRSCWKIIDEIDILNVISNVSEANIISSKERTEILNALKQKARENKPIDAKTTWIQFKQEIIDLETGEKIKASPKYFVVNPLPWSLGRTDETPTIDRLFKEWIVGGGQDERWIIALKEVFAFCMLPSYFIERIICFYGSGSNGKSCCLKLLWNFLGHKNICSTDLGMLVHSRFETARLFKKLVCMMGETNFEEIKNTQIIKRLVSGKDVVPMEFKNKNPFDTINYAKLIIATNNLPPSEDKSEGWYRKWLIFDFPNKFSEEKDILSEIPEWEYENFATQCVGILMRLLKERKFTTDGTIEERMKRYEDKSNPLDKFLKEFVVEAGEGFIWKFEFEKNLNKWCKERGHRSMSEVAIGRKMKERGYNQESKVANWIRDGQGGLLRAWVGIKWKENLQDLQDLQVISLSSLHRASEYDSPVKVVKVVNESTPFNERKQILEESSIKNDKN